MEVIFVLVECAGDLRGLVMSCEGGILLQMCERQLGEQSSVLNTKNM